MNHKSKTYKIPEETFNNAQEQYRMVSEPTVAYTVQQTPLHLDVTLEENAAVADIRTASKMIKGIASVTVTHVGNDNIITPALAKQIAEAHAEHERGKTISCSTPEELQRYLDSL